MLCCAHEGGFYYGIIRILMIARCDGELLQEAHQRIYEVVIQAKKLFWVMIMNKVFKKILIGSLIMFWISASLAEEVTKEQIKGLDEQVQDIKKDVLGISTELTQLEEKLLYPSNTQVSVFVSLEKGAKFRLDALKIKIDGKDVSSHIYTFKELDALQNGGVQRLYTGNIRTGEHTLEVSLIAKSSGNNDEPQTASHKFTKSVEPKLIEIALSGQGSANQRIGFKD